MMNFSGIVDVGVDAHPAHVDPESSNEDNWTLVDLFQAYEVLQHSLQQLNFQ